MSKYFKKTRILISAVVYWSLPYLALAADSPSFNNLKKVGEGAETGKAPWIGVTAGKNDLAGIVGIVIQAFLGLLGVLFLSYILYAGYTWMTAQGEEEKVTKAKDTLQRAVIGLIITIGAYAISIWVFDKLLTGTNIIK